MTFEIDARPVQWTGTRRLVTALFSDVCGSTRIAESLEPEDYAQLLGSFREIWRTTISEHGGKIVSIQGDGVFAVFGYPDTHEDDARRAVDAALDIHDRVRRLRVPENSRTRPAVQMHSGVHAGTVVISEGDPEIGRLDLSGDITNTAARLAAAAGVGQVLVSEESLGPYAQFFELGECTKQVLRGRSTPLSTVAVLRRANVSRRFDATARRGLTPFIGRQTVLRALRRFLDTDPPAATPCFVIVAAAGLGKSRVLEELAREIDVERFLVLRGGCEKYLDARVLQPFAQMLQCLLGVTSRTAAPQPGTSSLPGGNLSGLEVEAARLLQLPGFEHMVTGPSADAGGVVDRFGSLFKALASSRRLVMLVDDWQWADSASRRLMEYLLHEVGGLHVILAGRPREESAEWIAGAPHLVLTPFAASESVAAIRRWLPEADPFLAGSVHAYAGGVPLFIEEICHSVAAGGPLRSPQHQGRPQAWLASLIASRLDRLPADLGRMVRASAVIGNVIPIDLLQRVLGKSCDDSELRALAEADFLYPDDRAGTLRFKHGITRDAVYEATGLGDRTAWHSRTYAALLEQARDSEREDALEGLAYHGRGAGNWDRAAHFAERAGDKAMAAFALDRARSQYLAAMEALDREPAMSSEQGLRWCLLANKLAMVGIFDPLAFDNDLSVFERAVQLAARIGDEQAIARSMYWLGYMCYGFGRLRAGVDHARDALSKARALSDAPLSAQISAALGQMLVATCDYNEAIPLIDAAVTAKRRRSRLGGGMAVGSAYALSCKGSALADQGDFAGAHQCFDEAMLLLGESMHPVGTSVRNWICVANVWQGHWERAEFIAVEGGRIAENTRGLLLLAVSRAVAGYSRWAGSGLRAGLDQLRDAVRWMEARRGDFYASLFYGWLVEACIAEDQIDEARRHAARLLRRSREGERLGEAVGCRALAIAAARSGDTARCEQWMARAERSTDIRRSRRESALNLFARAQCLETTGRAAAISYLERAAAEFDALEMSWHAARARSAIG
ncbi:MAG TPA: AAA family ATPase [Burkholderiaceae bacterium]|nr:AAA family ATPase [Burkholderiaceae bacterium]